MKCAVANVGGIDAPKSSLVTMIHPVEHPKHSPIGTLDGEGYWKNVLPLNEDAACLMTFKDIHNVYIFRYFAVVVVDLSIFLLTLIEFSNLLRQRARKWQDEAPEQMKTKRVVWE